jgi:hypothetical protein
MVLQLGGRLQLWALPWLEASNAEVLNGGRKPSVFHVSRETSGNSVNSVNSVGNSVSPKGLLANPLRVNDLPKDRG